MNIQEMIAKNNQQADAYEKWIAAHVETLASLWGEYCDETKTPRNSENFAAFAFGLFRATKHFKR